MKNKLKQKKPMDTTKADISKEIHKQIQHMSIDEDIEIRELYAKIVPLGIQAYKNAKKTITN